MREVVEITDRRISFTLPSIREFAERSFIIPSGAFRGTHYRADVNPVIHKLLSLYDHFHDDVGAREIYVVAGNQVGKTVSASIFITYALWELHEDVVVYGPTIQISGAICNDVYRSFLAMGVKPYRGSWRLRLPNGTVLTWRGQSDAQRSQVTARIVVISEAEKIQKKRTEEADPIDQIRARAMSFNNSKMIFESTLATESGFMWRSVMEADKLFRFHHRCPECGGLFIPRLETVFSDSYGCEKCGCLIPSMKRREAIEGGEFKDIRGGSGPRWAVHFNAIDSLLVDPLPTIDHLNKSQVMTERRRLFLQYLAEPPRLVFVEPPAPNEGQHRRGELPSDAFWCIGVDVGGSVSHYVILGYVPGEGFVRVVDLGRVTGSLKAQMARMNEILGTFDPNKGVLLYDYGYSGHQLARIWNALGPRHRALPIRGLNDLNFLIDPSVDIKWGDWWRYRRMNRGSGLYALQIQSVAAKDALMGLLYIGRLLLFLSDKDPVVKLYRESVCKSERPIERDGRRFYERVYESNHFFDATVYALAGLLFSGAPLDLSALPRVDNASYTAVEQFDHTGELVEVSEGKKHRDLVVRGGSSDVMI